MKRKINVSTDYGSIEIVNLKRVWINELLNTYRLMYEDDIYEYNCIYWSYIDPEKLSYFNELKQKLINAYNNGLALIEL